MGAIPSERHLTGSVAPSESRPSRTAPAVVLSLGGKAGQAEHETARRYIVDPRISQVIFQRISQPGGEIISQAPDTATIRRQIYAKLEQAALGSKVMKTA